MAVIESKLKQGTLTLGPAPGTEFACQATNVRIVPTFNEDGDTVETLCGDKVLPSVTTDWALQGTSIQDFDDPAGFVKFSWDNNMVDVAFTWEPNQLGTSFTGTVNVRALEVGGDVNTRITSDFEWPVKGDPVATWPPVVPLATKEKAKASA